MTDTAQPIAQPRRNRAHAAGVGVALTAALLLVWTTIVHDDGGGAAVFMVILAAGVGCFAARFRADGVARAMLGVAAMQAALGLLTATAPLTATLPASPLGGVAMAVFYHAGFAALWLVSAACFRRAARD